MDVDVRPPEPEAVRTKKLWSQMSLEELREARAYYEWIEMFGTDNPYTILHLQALLKGVSNWINQRLWQADYERKWRSERETEVVGSRSIASPPVVPSLLVGSHHYSGEAPTSLAAKFRTRRD